MKDIYKWLKSEPKDYEKGVAIFSMHCENKFLVKHFSQSAAQFSMYQLVAEMKMLLGIPINQIAMNAPLPVLEFRDEPTGVGAQKEPITTDDIPQIIKDAKVIYSKLREEISSFNEALFKLDTSNAADVVEQRAMLLNLRNPLIPLSDKIYVLKEEYFINKKISDELEDLLKIAKGEKKIFPDPELSLVEKIRAMTDLQIHKRRSNIVTQSNRYQNQLDYQLDRKGDQPNPMPDGPKRDKKLQQIEALKEELELILSEIEKRK